MGISNNSPTFSYVHFSGVSVVYNDELYMVQDYATNKKYIYYNVDLPNQLNSSNVMPNRSMKQFLVAINDNGMATLVPPTSDDFSISFDGNSTQAIKDRIFGLYEKNEEFGEKFVAIEQDIDGIRQMVGSGGTGGSGYDDSEVWEKFSQIEQTVDNIDLSVKETVKKYNDDKETNKLREDLNSSIIKINANLGTFKSEITDYFKNNEITEEEKVKIETQLGILENEKATLDGIVDTVKLIAENNNQTQDVVAIESAKNALNIAHNNLKNNVTNAIIDSIITTTEITVVTDSFAKYNLRINELKNTCDDIIILGLGGVITEELSNISMKTNEIKLSVSRVESDFKNDMSVQKIQLENQINDVNTALGTFEEIVNTTFKDGIIEESEKQLLKEKIELIDKEKVDIDVRYNSLIEDVYLSESIKSELINKYENYNLKHDELKSKIELVISDNMINDAEALEINTLFKQYSNSLAYCSAIMAKAIEDISFNMSKAELEQAKNELRNEIDDVKDSIGEIGGVIDGTFEDNILDEVERRDIQQNLENLSREKIDIDNTFNNLYNNKYLDSENKNKFKSIYDDYINAYNEVISVSNGILNKETLIDNVDRANLNSAILEHNDKLNFFSIEINRIMDVISLSQSNSFKDEVQKDISDVNDRIDDVLGDIDGAVADSVIDKAEAVIIRESLDIIEKEKLDVDARYETVYGNSFLSGSAKSNLLNAKKNFDLSTTDLIKIIISSIEDERVTENELTSINEKRDIYKNNSAVLNTRFQEAIDYITKAQVDKAKLDFNKEISDLGGVIENLENTMNGVFHDGILTEAEKLSINQHLLTLSSEKSDIDKQYQTIYSNTYLEGQEKTNLNTAYNNYVTAYNSLVSVIDGIVKKEGLVDSTDRNNLNNSFKNHNEKLGLYTVSATNALDSIAKKKAEVESEKIDKKYAEIIIDLEAGITSRVEHINTQLNGDGGINQRLQSAEEKITSEGITQIVKDTQFIKDMEGKINTNTSNISKVEQTANSITLTVSDLSGKYTSLKQSVDSIDLTGKVNFSDLYTPGKTTISGSNITTGTINANLANITNINASNITTGTLSGNRISGGTIEGSLLRTYPGDDTRGVRIAKESMQLNNTAFFYKSNDEFRIQCKERFSVGSMDDIYLMAGLNSNGSQNGYGEVVVPNATLRTQKLNVVNDANMYGNLAVSGSVSANSFKVGNNLVYHAGNKPTPSEIGASPTSHTHSTYLPTSGGTISGTLTVSGSLYAKGLADGYINWWVLSGGVIYAGKSINMNGYTITGQSDRSLKENINYVDRVKNETNLKDNFYNDFKDKFKFATYNYKKEDQKDRTHFGFIAQDIEDTSFSDYVLMKNKNENNEDVLGYDIQALINVYGSILQKEIETRDKQIEDLTSRLSKLEESKVI